MRHKYWCKDCLLPFTVYGPSSVQNGRYFCSYCGDFRTTTKYERLTHKPPTKNWKAWTDEEYEDLKRRLAEKQSWKVISMEMGRSKGSLQHAMDRKGWIYHAARHAPAERKV